MLRGSVADDGVYGCVDQNENCAEWARQGECQKNEPYMQSSCPKSCNTCEKLEELRGFKTTQRKNDGKTVAIDALGEEIDLHGDEWTSADRDTFFNNARINQDQPKKVPKFTDVGFKKMKIPDDLYSIIKGEWSLNAGAIKKGCNSFSCGFLPFCCPLFCF
jgi:hypothetical protein